MVFSKHSIALLLTLTTSVVAAHHVCSFNDLRNPACFKESEIFRWPMDAIARVNINGGSGGVCTGFLVGTGNYFMTNNHCISTQEVAEASSFQFNYQTKECTSGAKFPSLGQHITYTGADLIYTSEYRNSTLLKLRTEENLHERHGSLALSTDRPNVQDATYIIHHPDGGPKKNHMGLL